MDPNLENLTKFFCLDFWVQDKQSTYSLEAGKLFFVNRDDSVRQLQEIHAVNYYRATDMGVGRNWKIPLCDNLLGTGKSDFGRHYIEGCRKEWSDDSARTPVQVELCNCHTVHISFRAAFFRYGPESFEAVMLKCLISALRPHFRTLPTCFKIQYESTADFLEDLTASVGPIFIVLDEIGRAFEIAGLNHRQRSKYFLNFCEIILGGWMELPRIFFLLLGRGTFLNYVGHHPGCQEDAQQLSDSSYIIERVAIQHLRKKEIEEILERTYVDRFQQKTLVEYFALDAQETKTAANHLFSQTNGHPRTLTEALVRCRTKQELIAYAEPLPIEHFTLLCEDLIRNSNEIVKLLEKIKTGDKVNLLTLVSEGRGTVSLDIICSNALIAWAGTKQAATLYAPPSVVAFLTSQCVPFRKFIQVMVRCPEVRYDFSNIFETMIVKRFQELFSSKRCPNEVLPSFFSTPYFGWMENLLLPQKLNVFPKITSLGERQPTLKSITAHPSSWRYLMIEMDKTRAKCYMPPSASSSPDAIFRVYRSNLYITVALAAKNYDVNTPFGLPNLAKECTIFNQMFIRAPRVLRTNILIVCATSYTDDLKSRFNGRKFFVFEEPRFKHINEIVVLDLSSKAHLAEFFGLNDTCLVTSIEGVLKETSVLPTADDDEDE